MSGYFYCENCEGNAGGRQCVACSRPAKWIGQTPAQTIPNVSQQRSHPRKRPPGVSQERGHQRFAEIRAQLARVP